MLGAGIILRKHHFLPVYDVDDHKTAVFKGRFYGIGKTAAYFGLDDKTVDHYLDIVLFVFVKLDLLGKVIHAAVDPNSDKTAFAGRFEFFYVLSLSSADNGSHNLNFCPLGKSENLVDHLIHRLLLYFPAAYRAMGNSYTGKKQTHIIVYLGDRSHR